MFRSEKYKCSGSIKIDKMYLYTKDPNEAKYQLMIDKRTWKIGWKHCGDPKPFIEYSNDVDDIYKNIFEYIPNRKCKILILFDDMISDVLNNKNRNSIVTELFIRDRELNISLFLLLFITFFVLHLILPLQKTLD